MADVTRLREPKSSSQTLTDRANMSTPELYVVLSNTSGKQNLGTYLRTASAFGATQILVVGSQRYGTHGAHRAHKYVNVVHFYKFSEAQTYLKERNCIIYGIRQHDQVDSVAAHEVPYQGSSAFVIDNEGIGLSEEQVAICDAFVHVPFHGAPRAELVLDVTVVTAIVFHHFTKWAQFPMRPFESTSTQGKFVLDAYPTFDAATDTRAQQVAAEREAYRTQDVDALMADDLANIFG